MVFCDVVGSTALGESIDPEALQRLLARYFERMKTIVEVYGGTVEKFVGDAVMAVFGVPTSHEDDALRACRSALDMRDALPELGVRGRIGVNTGEVVVGTKERLAAGDPVNVAARLQQAAEPGEVLIGEATLALVRTEVEIEPVEPLVLKGKSGSVPVFRLLRIEDAVERRHESPFLGREGELAEIVTAWGRVLEGQSCELLTIVGDAGIGKSRLVAEALSVIDADVVRGRCPPYGVGVTYRPVVDVLRQLDDLPSDPIASATLSSLLDDTDHGSSADEIGWAFRRLLEQRAPLVVVLDDIQWAQDTFLDLVEGVALLVAGAPILLVCMARPELLGRRAEWPVTIRLAALPDDAVHELIAAAPDALRRRIAEAAGGNPLYLTEMLAIAEQGEAVGVPPTLRSLLATRLDQLDPFERAVLERAAIEGEVFHRGAVQALLADDKEVTPSLAALARKDLIRPDTPQLPGDDGFRFRHLLIRDAAYEALPKSTRADLHERFADWLERHGGARIDLPEILGYHLERAYRSHAELGEADENPTLRVRAAGHLGQAGRRALGRSDIPAAIDLLTRACELMPVERSERTALLRDLGTALGEAGRFAAAERAFDEARAAARQADGPAGEGRVRVEQLLMEFSSAPAGWIDDAAATVHELEPVLVREGDDLTLARLWRLSAMVSVMQNRMADLGAAMDRALVHAKRAGDDREAGLAYFWIPTAVVWGPVPAQDGITRCEELLAEVAGSRSAEAGVANALAMLYAMAGRAEEARAALRESVAIYRELGLEVLAAAAAMHAGPIELYLGDPVAAENGLREAMAVFERLGESGYRSTAAAWLARALNDQARFDEAEEATRLSDELASSDDTISQLAWRTERSRVHAHRGELEAAERLAREAIVLIEQSDALVDTGEAFLSLAEILIQTGRADEAARAAAEALSRFERKGIVRYAERARVVLARIPA